MTSMEVEKTQKEVVDMSDSARYHTHQTFRGWEECALLLSRRDEEQVRAWSEQVDCISAFNGLFLTVITLFIGISSTSLQPDNLRMAVDILNIISQQLNGTTTVSPVAPFKKDLIDVIQNSLLFASLLCCLISASIGLSISDWLCEYKLDLPCGHPRELVRVQRYRRLGVRRWRIRQLISMMSVLLNLAFVLFSVGMTLFARTLDNTLFILLICLWGFWVTLTWGAAVFSALSAQCPYRSPISRMLYVLLRVPSMITQHGLQWKEYDGMIGRERQQAEAIGTDLEVDALEYINHEYWSHQKLGEVNQCFKDVAPAKAKEAIQDIIVGRLKKDRTTFVHMQGDEQLHPELSKPPADENTLQLLRMWGAITSELSAGEISHMWCAGSTEPDGGLADEPDSEDITLWTKFRAEAPLNEYGSPAAEPAESGVGRWLCCLATGSSTHSGGLLGVGDHSEV